VRCGSEVITWAELDQRTDLVATGLAALGVGTGDRCAALLNNCPEFIETVIACMKLGAIFVPLNVRLAAPEVARLVGHSGSSVVVSDVDLRPRLELIDARVPVIVVGEGGKDSFHELRRVGEGAGGPAERPTVLTRPDDPLFICYTSGTTGLPKGAMLSHRNALQPALNQVLIHEVGKSDRLFLPFPLAFTGGLLSNAMLAYVSGAELVLERSFDPGSALRILVEQRITVFMAVPVIWQAIAGLDGFDDADLSALRVAKSGGAPVPVPLIRTYQAKGIEMIQGYALTEGGGITTTLHARDGVRKAGSAGIPTNGTKLRIVAEDGRACPAGEVGEIQVQGPEVMLGYWRDTEATAETLHDGWLRTGDLGYLDDEGHLWVVDRKKDMLICGGLNVYPAEIERVLERVPGVVEVAVIGVPHERWAEVPAAIVFADRPLDAGELVGLCRRELADFKVPHYVVFSEEPLPRTMSGKLLKRELSDRYRDVPDRMERVRADADAVAQNAG
jgi:fatty-acyl-CoA synthase